MRPLCLAAVIVLFALAPRLAWAQAADEQAAALLEQTVESMRGDHPRVVDSGADTQTIINDGAPAILVVACSESCTGIRVRLAAYGAPDGVWRSGEGGTRVLVVTIPPSMTASLSNFDAYIDPQCERRSRCVYRWALLSDAEAPSLESRGLPALTENEWRTARGGAAQFGWRMVPDMDVMRLFYPPQPLRQNESARVVLDCVVMEAGAVRCRPTDESKTNTEFADGALRLASTFRAETVDAAGLSTIGRNIRAPIRFIPYRR